MVIWLKRNIFVVCFVTAIGTWLPTEAKSEGRSLFVDNIELYTGYVVFDVVRYRGGLISLEDAQKRIGEPVFLGNHEFRAGSVKVEYPVYKIFFYQQPPEGEVRSNSWRGFYSFDAETKKSKILQVYRSEDELKPVFEFEMVGDELWQLGSGGWMYKMKPSTGLEQK